MENKERVCKKCGKKLPEGYKHRQCEACMNVRAEKLGKAWDVAKKNALPAAIIAVSIVSKGKIKLK